MLSIANNLRIVVDTNVIISALVFGGRPRTVTDLIGNDEVTLILSQEILSELRRIIVTKFPDFTQLFERFEKLLESQAVWVKLGSITVTASRDADDNKIIETAVLGKCHYIISGDKDLLDLKTYDDIKILNPDDFLTQIAKM